MSADMRWMDGPGVPGLVSVIIPTYNRARLLRRAIDSALGQTYRPVEVVVADDGSTDNTREAAAGYGPAVRYFHQANAGVSAARNLGLGQARGEFIALLDSDDSWLPWKLTAQVEVLRRCPEAGMVWTDMSAVDDAGRLLHETYLRQYYSAHAAVSVESLLARRGSLGDLMAGAPAELAGRPFYAGNIASQMILGNLVHTSTVLLRRERVARVGAFDESIRVAAEDYEFHLRTCFAGPVAFLDAPSIRYRIGAADQLTAPHLHVHCARNYLRILSHWLGQERDRIALPERVLRRQLAAAFRWVGEEELQVGEPGSARGHLWQSLRLQPAHPRTAVLWVKSMLPQGCVAAARRLRRALRGKRGVRPSAVLSD